MRSRISENQKKRAQRSWLVDKEALRPQNKVTEYSSLHQKLDQLIVT